MIAALFSYRETDMEENVVDVFKIRFLQLCTNSTPYAVWQGLVSCRRICTYFI